MDAAGSDFAPVEPKIQNPKSRILLTLLDGSPHDTLEAQAWRTIVDALPVEIELASPRQTQPVIERFTEVLQYREANAEGKFPPMLLFVFNIAKFRDLRKAEDDFGLRAFGGSGEQKPAEPGRLFADLLSRGPENGIHTIIWCDSYNNVDRWFSRQTMRDLEQRIAFQMNAADSSNLIDSPLAARLGTHRALLYREETGTAEKFRPYGLPTTDWLAHIAQRMTGAEGPSTATSLEEFSIL